MKFAGDFGGVEGVGGAAETAGEASSHRLRKERDSLRAHLGMERGGGTSGTRQLCRCVLRARGKGSVELLATIGDRQDSKTEESSYETKGWRRPCR